MRLGVLRQDQFETAFRDWSSFRTWYSEDEDRFHVKLTLNHEKLEYLRYDTSSLFVSPGQVIRPKFHRIKKRSKNGGGPY